MQVLCLAWCWGSSTLPAANPHPLPFPQELLSFPSMPCPQLMFLLPNLLGTWELLKNIQRLPPHPPTYQSLGAPFRHKEFPQKAGHTAACQPPLLLKDTAVAVLSLQPCISTHPLSTAFFPQHSQTLFFLIDTTVSAPPPPGATAQ